MPKVFLDLLEGLIEKMGATIAGVVLIAMGAIVMLPYFGVPVYMAQGIGLVAMGVGVIAFGKRSKKTQDMFVASEAEKRISNPHLSDVSSVPPIQAEIVKQLNGKGSTVQQAQVAKENGDT